MKKPSQNPAPLSDRQLRRIAAEQREADEAAEAALADAVVRGADGKPSGIKAEALPHITVMARNGRHQDFVASYLGLTAKQFRVLLGTGDAPTATRLAFERGHVDFEAEIQARLIEHGKRWAPSLMFVAKSRLKWREVESVVDVRNEDNRRIQINLPAAPSFGEMLKGFGITAPMDFRKDKSKPLESILSPSMQADIAEAKLLAAPKSDDVIDVECVEVSVEEPAPQVLDDNVLPIEFREPLEVIEERERSNRERVFNRANGRISR